MQVTSQQRQNAENLPQLSTYSKHTYTQRETQMITNQTHGRSSFFATARLKPKQSMRQCEQCKQVNSKQQAHAHQTSTQPQARKITCCEQLHPSMQGACMQASKLVTT